MTTERRRKFREVADEKGKNGQLQEQVRRMTDEKLEREFAYAERAAAESGLSGLEAAFDELRAERERRGEGASAYGKADKEDHRTCGT